MSDDQLMRVAGNVSQGQTAGWVLGGTRKLKWVHRSTSRSRTVMESFTRSVCSFDCRTYEDPS